MPTADAVTGADCQGMSVDDIAAKLGLTDSQAEALGNNGILGRLAQRGITETADWHGAGLDGCRPSAPALAALVGGSSLVAA